MSPQVVGLIGLGLLFLLMFARMQLGFAMALIGFIGFGYIMGFEGAIKAILGLLPYSASASYTMSVIPLFMLMGNLAFHSGITEDFYRTMHTWLGELRGGLAMATIGGCAGFAAISGTSVAVSSTMTKVALPEMRRYGYDPKLATGCIAAGGPLGILIPPSLAFIVYAMITETSVGKLFIAGILPGVLLTTLFCLTIYILTKLKPEMGPPGSRTSLREKFISVKGVWQTLLLFIVVMGGIWGGIFTPTEAAAIGACGAFIIILSKRRLTKQNLASSFVDTVRITGMTFAIFIGAVIFSVFMAVSTLPIVLSGFISTLAIPPWLILVAILSMFLILGCIMSVLEMTLIVVPIVFPTVVALGFDPVFFGVLVTIMAEMGLVTPPVGINVFIIAGVAKDIPTYDIFQGVVPFLMAEAVCIAIIIAFPQIALLLPGIMIGK